jgi:hypothetical protein
VVYRINLRSFELFRDFMDVIMPEFIESRGEVKE